MAEDIRTMHEEDEDEVKYCERKRLTVTCTRYRM